MKNLKIIKYLFLHLIGILLLLSSCNNNESKKVNNILIVGTAADNPPYEFIQDSNIIGLDIDIIKLIAKELGKEVIIKNLDFPALLVALSSKKIDLVIAGLSVSKEREKYVDFSDTYSAAKVAVLFKDNKGFIKYEDIQGQNIGAQLGTTWQEIAKDINKDSSDSKLRFLSNNLILVEELKSSVIDAVILEDIQASKFIVNNPQLRKFVIEKYISEFAIALPKNSPLKNQINQAIAKLKKNGEIEKVRQKWY